jgi:hypothetical protein
MNNRAAKPAAISLVVAAFAVTWVLGHAEAIGASLKAEPAMLPPGSCGNCVQHSGMLALASLQTARLNVVIVRIQVIPLRLSWS